MADQSLELFNRACGATASLQLLIEGPGQPDSRPSFTQPFAILGRDPRNDWQLSDPLVSRRHVYIQMIRGSAFALDLSSRTGIHWGQHRGENGWLLREQPIRIGSYQISILSGDQADGPPPREEGNPLLPSPLEGRLPKIHLEFLNGKTRKSAWTMNRQLALVGRGPNCKVQMVTSTVSLVHCSLVRTSEGLWVVDLMGRGGTLVNGAQVRWSRLDDGDMLQVGKMAVRIWHESSGRSGFPAPLVPMPNVRAPASAPVASAPVAPASNTSQALAPRTPAFGPLTVSPAGSSLAPGLSAMVFPEGMVPDKVDSVTSVLFPIVNQFAVMQQQMFDQFQQTVMMMVQMFSSLHKDQVGLIREELDRLHTLTHELQDLQVELARNPAPATPKPVPQLPGPAPTLDAALDLAAIARMKALLAQTEVASGGAPPATIRKPMPVPSTGQNGDRVGAAPVAKAAVPRAAKEKEAAPATASVDAASTEQTQPSDQPDQDIHAWLCQRISAIQEERQTRWQKITGFLLGKRNPQNAL